MTVSTIAERRCIDTRNRRAATIGNLRESAGETSSSVSPRDLPENLGKWVNRDRRDAYCVVVRRSGRFPRREEKRTRAVQWEKPFIENQVSRLHELSCASCDRVESAVRHAEISHENLICGRLKRNIESDVWATTFGQR